MNQVLSDGSATGITYGLAGQDGEAWVQSYTPKGSATDYVIHDQQGTPLGYVQSGTAYASRGRTGWAGREPATGR